MKLKVFFIIISLAIFISGFGQKYSTKNGMIHFEASVPLFEDIDAVNKNAIAVLNADNGDIAIVSVVKNYKFKVALMEEHFNENYAESAKYPKATFTGKVLNFKKPELDDAKEYIISGKLNFHGVDQNVQSKAKVFKKDGKIFITGKFNVKPAHFDVTIPKMVTKKIAENVNVDYNLILVIQK